MSLTAIQQWICIAGAKRLVSGLALGVLLVGCSSAPPGGVRVVDRTNGGAARTTAAAPQRPATTTGQYRVQRSDTLYSIAFRFGWDWRALAASNNIPAPYTIKVGQVIRFDGGRPPTVVRAPVATANTGSKPPLVVVPTTTVPVIARPAQPPVVTTPATTPVQPVSRSATGWAWPTGGALIGKFSSNGSLNKGIDIAGELGQPVLAASDGSVVYAGSGLRGYGELVIIKHSDTYVSAYGHNRKLLVREGQQVKVGQTIAEMGSTGTDRVKLHFEIRRQGKPVDPLQFLPAR
ncbi:MAG: peptidoglycan DD-metalloendopeptidase family protein [Pseudomonas sp.]